MLKTMVMIVMMTKTMIMIVAKIVESNLSLVLVSNIQKNEG